MRRTLFLGLLCLLPLLLSAQTDRLRPETLWDLGRVSLDDVSPDGQTALYGVTWYDLAANKGNRDLYIVPVRGGAAKKITAFEGSEYNATYRPDGRKIGFLRAGQLWEMNPDGSDQRQVSKESMNGFRWSPDGKYILFTREVKAGRSTAEIWPDLPLATGRVFDDLMHRHWDSWDDLQVSNVFHIGYRDGALSGEPVNIMNEPFDSPLQPFGGMEEIAWSPDSRYIAYTCKKLRGKAAAESTNSDIYLYELVSGKTINVSEGMPGYDKEPVFSPDGRWLLWSSMERPGFEADRVRLFRRDMQSGRSEELTVGLDMSADHPQWSADGKTIYFMGTVRGTVQLHALDVATRRVRAITQGVHNYAQFKVADAGTLVGARMSMSEPVELFRVNIATGAQEAITSTNRAIWEKLRLGRVESRTVRTSDGKDMLVWVILPPDFDPKKTYPTLLYCQGGPQSAVSQFFSYRWNFQLMAAQGYVVVAPNRRGLPGFGQDWNDQISGDWGGQAMQDLLSAIDDVRKEPWVDNARLGAVGASYGGFSVYWLAGNHQKRFKSFISHCGTFNLESWYGTTEEIFFADFDLGGPYWQQEVPRPYREQSPHLFVRQWDTPVLVIHNEKDFRVPLGEGLQAFQAARKQDLRSRFLYFPDENHWVLKPQNSVLWQRVFFQWLAETLH
jgi:dipeptidyl aminopeptidase/acylaminoacyl peptidase